MPTDSTSASVTPARRESGVDRGRRRGDDRVGAKAGSVTLARDDLAVVHQHDVGFGAADVYSEPHVSRPIKSRSAAPTRRDAPNVAMSTLRERRLRPTHVNHKSGTFRAQRGDRRHSKSPAVNILADGNHERVGGKSREHLKPGRLRDPDGRLSARRERPPRRVADGHVGFAIKRHPGDGLARRIPRARRAPPRIRTSRSGRRPG